jgi:hypothetical protein
MEHVEKNFDAQEIKLEKIVAFNSRPITSNCRIFRIFDGTLSSTRQSAFPCLAWLIHARGFNGISKFKLAMNWAFDGISVKEPPFDFFRLRFAHWAIHCATPRKLKNETNY